jgi:aubergine-like protein
MIIGIDMYKDSSNRNLSALAFVASLNGDDQNCSRYYSRVVMQERKASYSDRLQNLMKGNFIDYSVFISTVYKKLIVISIDSLEQYLKVNGYLPAKVLIYRDGVGDSQLRDVKDYEIDKQIRKSFDLFPDYKFDRNQIYLSYLKQNNFFFYNFKDQN